jgi:hypothetical protein
MNRLHFAGNCEKLAKVFVFEHNIGISINTSRYRAIVSLEDLFFVRGDQKERKTVAASLTPQRRRCCQCCTQCSCFRTILAVSLVLKYSRDQRDEDVVREEQYTNVWENLRVMICNPFVLS